MPILDPTFAPLQSADEFWQERSFFAGLLLNAVSYGIHVSVVFTCLYLLKGQRRIDKTTWFSVVYILILFIAGTLNFATNATFGQMTWIDNRNISGGPLAFTAQYYTHSINLASNGAYVAANFFADALLIFRVYVVFHHMRWIVILPALIFLASTAMSVVAVWQVARPGSNFWSNQSILFIIPYYSISLSLNVILTLMIVARLFLVKRSLLKSLGKEHAATYISIIAILTESAALYSSIGFFFLVTVILKSHLQNLILPILCQVVCIAPEFIMLRVALGRAWKKDTATAATGGSWSVRPGMSMTTIDVELNTRRFSGTDTTRSAGNTTFMQSIGSSDKVNSPI